MKKFYTQLSCHCCKKQFTRRNCLVRFRRSLGMRSFCSRACYTQWSHKNHKGAMGKTIKCAHCGKLKYKRPSDLNCAPNAKLRFCSNKCLIQYKQRGNYVESCKHCGKKFEQQNCFRGIIKFCSRKCKSESWGRRTVICEMCGKPKSIAGWDYNRNLTKNFYCSRECLRKGRLHAKKPTIFEQRINDFLQANFPGQWTYTGNGDIWINGQNPDFAHADKKVVIEANGCYYHACPQCYPNVKWANLSSPLERAASYNALNYNVIFVWEHDLKQNDWQERLKNRINDEVLQFQIS